MRTTINTFSFTALLLVFAQAVFASALGYPFRISDDSGSLVGGVTITINGTAVAASTNGAAPTYVAVTVSNAANFADVPSINVAYYNKGNGDYLLVYDAEVNGDAYIPLTVSKAGSTISGGNALLPIIATRESGRILNNVDAAVSSRSVYAGTDTAGTTTLLARVTAQRASNLDYLTGDAFARLGAPVGGSHAADVASNLSAINALPAGIFGTTAATYNAAGTFGAKLNAAGSSSDPLANALSTYTTAGTGGYLLNRLLGFTAPTQFTATALALAPSGSAADPWGVLLTAENTAGSFGAFVKTLMVSGNVTVGGYAAGQEPETRLFATPRWQKFESVEVGAYTRSGNVYTFTRQDGTTFTMTLSGLSQPTSRTPGS